MKKLEASRALPAGAPPWTGSDTELVAMVCSGHVHAAKWLHDRFARPITRVVFRILGGDADHEDLVHEIFMRIWSLIAAGKVREPAALGGWVLSVATHILYKELRRRYVRQRFLRRSESAPKAVAAIQDDEARDILLAVYRILADMPPAERLVFGLRYLDQRKLADLAPMCGISVATAKRRLGKAERTFTNLIQRHGDYAALRTLVPPKKRRG
ncbi:MAG: sigma-70 family RNA polymerase sigma factor [Deltaproteobacteria bacterium]|nr:sigma-70 family RNA polymerase sigma factor [Deltaproteobacteria bacterium]